MTEIVINYDHNNRIDFVNIPQADIDTEKLNAFYDNVLEFKLTKGNLIEKGLIKIIDEFDDVWFDDEIIKCKIYRKYYQLEVSIDNFVAICKVGDPRSVQYMIYAYMRNTKNIRVWRYKDSLEIPFYGMLEQGLYAAIKIGHIAIVQLLLSIPKLNKSTYLFLACENNHIAMVEMLIANKMPITDYDVMRAIEHGNDEVLLILLRDFQFDRMSSEYYLALEEAVKTNNLTILKILINNNLVNMGFLINILHIAKERDHKKIVKYLNQLGAY
jgi:hypothetical protein